MDHVENRVVRSKNKSKDMNHLLRPTINLNIYKRIKYRGSWDSIKRSNLWIMVTEQEKKSHVKDIANI